MKILILADLHLHTWSSFNLNKASDISRRLMEQHSILEQITLLAENRKIDSVEIIGDIFHKVGEIPVICLNIFDGFMSTLEDLGIPVFITTGNHDIITRESPSYIHNSTSIFARYQGNVYKDVKIKRIGYSENIDYDEVKGYDIVLLHKTPSGSVYNKFVFNDGVDWKRLSSNNKFVFFGHIHQRQELTESCIVVGSPMHLTFGDDGERGCYILDTEKCTVEFVKLKYPEFRNVDTLEDVTDDYNYYKIKNIKGQVDKANVIAVSIPDFFEERLKSTTFDGIINEWLTINKKDDAYLEIVKPLLSDKFRLPQELFKGKLTSVTIKNFISIEEMSYRVGTGFILVKGQNEGFSSNGSGKTTMFEAIYWALFNETTKGLTGDDVIRRGQKDCSVVLVLDDGREEYIVNRSRKYGLDVIIPNDDDKNFIGLRESDKQVFLESLLGFDKNIFLASCYFSQENLVMLTSMSDVEKTNTITGLLGFEAYSDLYDTVLNKINTFLEDIRGKEKEKIDIDKNIAVTTSSLSQLNEQLSEITSDIESLADKIKVSITEIDVLKDKLSKLSFEQTLDYDEIIKELENMELLFNKHIEEMDDNYSKRKDERNDVITEQVAVKKEIELLNKEMNILKNNLLSLDTLALKSGQRCRTCGSVVTAENIESLKSELKEKITTGCELAIEPLTTKLVEGINLEKSLSKSLELLMDKRNIVYNKRIDIRQEIKDTKEEKKRKDKEFEIFNLTKQDLVYNINRFSDTEELINKQRIELNTKKSTVEVSIKSKSDVLNGLVIKIKDLDFYIDKIKKSIDILEFWKTAFSSKGIRVLLLDKFCNEMNSIVNNYLSSISSGFMSLSIKPTSSLKSGEERNKLGLDIFMKGVMVKYQSLSGGEKRRVDVALCLGLNDWISKRFNLSNGLLGFIVLDEVFSFLDDSAEETIGSLLYQEGFKKAIYVISHTSELEDYSNTTWTVSKKNGISRLELPNEDNLLSVL